jgi:dihydroorotate dehydrogenase electron transfer subunit
MKKTVQSLQVISHRRLNSDHVVLELKSDVKLEGILPGQFANILVEGSQKVFLRRPFSIYQVDYNCNTISVLIKAIGDGTHVLSDQVIGNQLSVIFPLGNGFILPTTPTKVLLVGGGVGIAALMILAKMLKENGNQVFILLGAKREVDLVEMDEFAKYGTIFTTTEDGSHGTKGYVTDHFLFREECSSFGQIYTCGPEPMMKAVARLALIHHVNCEVSLENTMACGYGVCLCCVTETIDGHRCVCTDGPVFDIKRLKWQI